LPQEIQIDVRRLVFPLVGGRELAAGFARNCFLGTGFFVSRRGLALTAAHVVSNLDGLDVRAALPTSVGPMTAHNLRWIVRLPGSDIAVVRVNTPTSTCFALRFESPVMGQNVETTAIPESMLLTDSGGRTKVQMRITKGYVSHGGDGWVAASFALPKGMSGAPLIVTNPDSQFVAGVFVGQNRGEEIEDQIEELTDDSASGRHTHVERVSRIEYFARGELLSAFADFIAPEFEGVRFKDLIMGEIAG
jgi:hypothetical protein